MGGQVRERKGEGRRCVTRSQCIWGTGTQRATQTQSKRKTPSSRRILTQAERITAALLLLPVLTDTGAACDSSGRQRAAVYLGASAFAVCISCFVMRCASARFHPSPLASRPRGKPHGPVGPARRSAAAGVAAFPIPAEHEKGEILATKGPLLSLPLSPLISLQPWTGGRSRTVQNPPASPSWRDGGSMSVASAVLQAFTLLSRRLLALFPL